MPGEQNLWATERPRLTLYDGREAGPGLSAHMTLWEFYCGYARPVVLKLKCKPRGLDVYDQVLRRWKELTGDPPLKQIDEETLSGFLQQLEEFPATDRQGRVAIKRLAPNTRRKHWAHLDRVLKLAGPRTRENRSGKGLVKTIPFCEPPPKEHTPVKPAFTLEEINQWLAVCRLAPSPRTLQGITAAQFWRALIYWIYNVGTRIETTLAVEWDMIRGDWLYLPPAIMKGHAGKEPCVNAHALAAIEPLRRAGWPRVFPWPHGSGWLQAVRRGLLATSRIAPLRQRELGFHALRRAMTGVVAQRHALVAQDQLGHTQWETTARHYLPREVRVRVMNDLPQPDPSSADPQRRLF